MFKSSIYNRREAYSNRKYRSELEIIADILRAFNRNNANGGSMVKTRIMYSANLNTKMLSEYLGRLVKQGLIKENEVDGKKLYNITPKGILTLSIIHKLNNILSTAIEKNREEYSKKVLEVIENILNDNGMYVRNNIALTGESGILHHYDLIGRGSKTIAIKISHEDPDAPSIEYLWFMLSLIDTDIKTGLFISISDQEKMSKKCCKDIVFYKLSIPLGKDISVLKDQLSLILSNMIGSDEC